MVAPCANRLSRLGTAAKDWADEREASLPSPLRFTVVDRADGAAVTADDPTTVDADEAAVLSRLSIARESPLCLGTTCGVEDSVVPDPDDPRANTTSKTNTLTISRPPSAHAQRGTRADCPDGLGDDQSGPTVCTRDCSDFFSASRMSDMPGACLVAHNPSSCAVLHG